MRKQRGRWQQEQQKLREVMWPSAQPGSRTGRRNKRKPVGLVYIGCCVGEEIRVKECRFRNPSREPASDGGDGFAVGSGNVTRENIVEERK